MINREFFLGFIKIHILYHAAKEAVFGAEITEELGRHGYHVGPGTLYPALHRLEKEGYLVQSQKIVNGKVRKYYCVTDQGNDVLKEASKKIRELIEEVLEDHDKMPGHPAQAGGQLKK